MFFSRLYRLKLNKTSLILFIAGVLFLMGIYRGIRFPRYWGATHYFLSYDLGFIKRGLIGSIISLSNITFLYSYQFVFLFSFALFLINCLLLFSLIRELIKTNNLLVRYCALIYCSSYAIIMFTYCIGFFDHILLLFTLCLIKVNNFTYRYWLFLILMPIVLCIHEAAFLIFFPVIFLTFWLGYLDKPSTDRLVLIFIAGLISISIVCFLSAQTLPAEQIFVLYQQLQNKVDFTVHPGVLTLLGRSGTDNIFYVYQSMSMPGYQFNGLNSLVITLPSLCFLIVSVRRHIVIYKKHSLLNCFFVFFACLSPLLLHLWGTDVNRWHTLTITTTFLVLYLLVRYRKKKNIDYAKIIKKEWFFILFMMIVSFNLYANFFGMQAINNSPFRKHFEQVVKDFIKKRAFSSILIQEKELTYKRQR